MVAIFALLASLSALASLLTTRFGNVPINIIVRFWVPSSPPSNWLNELHRWDIFHYIRTTMAILSFVCVSISVHFEREMGEVKTEGREL
jgi:hypothetical protein